MKLISSGLIGLVRLYQYGISPLMPPHCRYSPTCSHYACQALQEHGPLRGSWLTLRRLLRCHPWGGEGYDPVPPAEERAEALASNGSPGRSGLSLCKHHHCHERH